MEKINTLKCCNFSSKSAKSQSCECWHYVWRTSYVRLQTASRLAAGEGAHECDYTVLLIQNWILRLKSDTTIHSQSVVAKQRKTRHSERISTLLRARVCALTCVCMYVRTYYVYLCMYVSMYGYVCVNVYMSTAFKRTTNETNTHTRALIHSTQGRMYSPITCHKR
jgi:hypothetical protein